MSMELNPPFRVFIAGRTGSGKSYLAGWLAEQLYRARQRWVILDYQSRNHAGLTHLKGVKLVRVHPHASYQWLRLLKYPHVVIAPTRHTTREHLIEQYEQVLRTLFDYDKNRIIFIEETHNYMNAYKLSPAIELLLREGRHQRLSLIMITQRVQQMNKFAWSQCTHTITFKWANHIDINYISQTIPDFEHINASLGEHDAVLFDHKTLQHEVIRGSELIRATKHLG